jgi:hypothetical protein
MVQLGIRILSLSLPSQHVDHMDVRRELKSFSVDRWSIPANPFSVDPAPVVVIYVWQAGMVELLVLHVSSVFKIIIVIDLFKLCLTIRHPIYNIGLNKQNSKSYLNFL